MPALRKCLASIFPSCFSSTQQNSNYNEYSGTPNARTPTSKRSKARSGLGSALQSFGGITKTVDTDLTVTRVEDDEQELVHMQGKNGSRAQSHWSLGEGSDKSDGERRTRRA
jgi:hypothetical protein